MGFICIVLIMTECSKIGILILLKMSGAIKIMKSQSIPKKYSITALDNLQRSVNAFSYINITVYFACLFAQELSKLVIKVPETQLQ